MNLKDAIREAVDEREKQESIEKTKPASSNAVKTASNKSSNTVKSNAVNTVSSKTVKPASSKAAKQQKHSLPTTESEVTAALTVRVSRRHRIHWLISAKQQGTSLTAAITEALNARFGEPVE